MDISEKQEKKEVVAAVEDLIDENRVVGFSDAVFAFAATLLVLKIDLPNVTLSELTNQFPQVLRTLGPQYLANIISFLIIGYYWVNHHAIFGLLKKFNATIVWINIIFLIFLSFLPFPVDLYGSFPSVPMVIVFYSASLALVGFILAGIWGYASYRHRLIRPDMSDKHIKYYMARQLVAPIVFVLSMPLAYIHPIVAQLSWLFVLVGAMTITRAFGYRKLSAIEKIVV